MDYGEFVEKYNSNKITVRVDRNKAGFMLEDPTLMPQHFRAQQAKLRALGFGGVIAGIALFFFVQWWIALTVLILAFYIFPRAQKQAADAVLNASLYNPLVYHTAIANAVFDIQEV